MVTDRLRWSALHVYTTRLVSMGPDCDIHMTHVSAELEFR